MKEFIFVFFFIFLFMPRQGYSNGIPWQAPERAKRKTNPYPEDSSAIQSGKKVYETACLPCHGAQGRGDGTAAKYLDPKPRDLSDPTLLAPQTDGELFWKITEGRSNMPSFKEALSEEERWQVIHYLRALSQQKSK